MEDLLLSSDYSSDSSSDSISDSYNVQSQFTSNVKRQSAEIIKQLKEKRSRYETKTCYFVRKEEEEEDEDYEPPLNQLAIKKRKELVPFFESKLDYCDTSTLVWAKHHRFGLSCGRVRTDMIWCNDEECFIEFFCLPKGKRDLDNIVKVYKNSVEKYNSDEKHFTKLRKVLTT
jgi:hypothetical protein